MNIAIDVSPLKTDHRIRGTGTYTKLLIEALQKYESKHSYYFFTRGQKLPENIDIVHYPYFEPFFLTLPLGKPKPVSVTVHDLIPIAYPTHFTRGIRGEIKWLIQRWSLSQTNAIIADSGVSKADIHRYAHIPQEKIYVVYLAPAEFFRQVNNRLLLRKASIKYRLPERFILYVGDVNWNKNLSGLLRAVENLKNSKMRLVLIGKSFLNENLVEVKDLNKLMQGLNIENLVMKLGFVPDDDLVAVYNLASVYVQPSFTEGFGLPVLEAMACGCPVVVSKAPSLQEISGPSLSVDADKPYDIASGIKKALEINREDWARKAAAWANQFSWKRTAKQTAAVYEKALIT